MRGSLGPYVENTARYFGEEVIVRTEEEMAEEYRGLEVAGVLLGWDNETATGLPPVPNDWVADMVRRFPNVFPLGFAGLDPWKGKAAIRELERSVKELGLRGVKVHPVAGQFYPNDPRFYPLWEKCQELGVPLMSHSGTTGLGAGLPGAMGVKLKYGQPIFLDDVAADFPGLTIICAHHGFPWESEAIALALHKGNVFMDLSGYAPKYFSPTLIHEINTRLQNKVVFGTDYPFMPPKRWLTEFQALEIRDGVRSKVLLENARRILGLSL